MLELTGGVKATFIEVVTDWLKASGDAQLVATGEELFQWLLDLPEDASAGAGNAEWFVAMPAESAWDTTGQDRHDHDHGSQDAAGIVEALGLLTAFTRGDLDL